MSARRDRLVAIRTSIETIVATQTAAWEAAGCPPTMSIDGESYDWNGWLTSKIEAIERLSKLIQSSTPYAIRSRQRG